MIRYRYKNAKLLFIGINPHFGSFSRGVPFSNNKLFWYLLARAGIIAESETELKDDVKLRQLYGQKFNRMYRLGFANIVGRPTRTVADLQRGEEAKGRKKIRGIIHQVKPDVVCFVGKITYQKFSGEKDVSFGWQDTVGRSKIFLMHAPSRGEASMRVRELKLVANAAQIRIQK